MIVVIADDISGAAELAGAAADYGLSAEVQTAFHPESRVEVIAVDTDSRMLPARQAAARLSRITRQIVRTHPAWIYKKTDSVLRGHVRPELEAILAATGQLRALLIPANPSKERIIRDGTYFIGGQPLDQTAFAEDPHYPATSADVLLLMSAEGTLNVEPIGQEAARSMDGILIPDAADEAAVKRRAREMDDDTLPAGGVDFFRALLQERTLHSGPSGEPTEAASRPGSALFLCGSLAGWETGRRDQCQEHGIPVTVMPARLPGHPGDEAALSDWISETQDAFTSHTRVMMAIGTPEVDPESDATEILVPLLVTAAAGALGTFRPDHIYLEGGATASEFLKQMKWTRLTAHPGGILRVADRDDSPALHIKPGSYPWSSLALRATGE